MAKRRRMMDLEHFVTLKSQSFYLSQNHTYKLCKINIQHMNIWVNSIWKFGTMVIQKYHDEFGAHQFSLIFHENQMLYTSKPENFSTDTLKIAIDEISVKNVENKGFFDGSETSIYYGVLIVQLRRVLLTQYLFQ